MERTLSHWLYAMLYGEANRCRHPLLPITENVFGGNGIQRLTLYEGGDKDAQPSAYLKSKLYAQLYRFGTQPHFCIAYVIG